MSPASSCRRVTLVMATALAAIAATGGPAMARSAVLGCPAATMSNPFTRWGDLADYQLAPAGDVEDWGASWSLRGAAAAASGNETFKVNKATDHVSMRLPASSSASTARMCIGVEHRSFRFFAKRSGGSSSSRLLVEVVRDGPNGRDLAVPAGLVSAADQWAPAPSLPTVVNLLAAAQNNAMGVSFRFTPQGSGVWSVDDLYVDPMRGR